VGVKKNGEGDSGGKWGRHTCTAPTHARCVDPRLDRQRHEFAPSRVHMLAGVVRINPDEIAALVAIRHQARGDPGESTLGCSARAIESESVSASCRRFITRRSHVAPSGGAGVCRDGEEEITPWPETYADRAHWRGSTR